MNSQLSRFEQNFSRQRIAVAVNSARHKTDEHIAGNDLGRLDDLRFLDNADNKAGEIVFAVGKIAGVLGGFAADQRAPRLSTTRGDAAHHRLGDFDIELAAHEVVKKKQRLSALSKNIVHAHRHQIDADGVVNSSHESDLEFCSDSVRRRNQYG